ncbi:MAG: hypothetical protein KJ638_08405 [Chloroflexi bacterium]|nr:hypothetical protein [Chloroflexota bacterium]
MTNTLTPNLYHLISNLQSPISNLQSLIPNPKLGGQIDKYPFFFSTRR